jgi:hypothetical protein
MNFKTTSLLFGLLFLMLLVFGIAVQAPVGAADRSALFPAIAEMPSLAIDTVVVEKKGKQIRLVKAEKGWRLEEPPGTQQTRADETKVDQIIDQVRRARKVEEAVVTRNLATVGLEPPRTTVTLKEKGAGREWTLNVGDPSPDKEYVYCTTSLRPHDVVAVQASSLDSLAVESAADLRLRTLLDVTDTNADFVRLEEPADRTKKVEKTELVLEKTSEGLWVFKTPPQFGAADFAGTPPPREEPGVKGLLNAIGGARVENAADFEPLGAHPLDYYGLATGQEALRIDVERAAGLFGADKDKRIKESLLVGKKIKDQYYVRLTHDDGVARVSAKKLELAFRVAREPKTLRSRDLINIAADTVDVVDLRWGAALKQQMQLRRPDRTLWKLEVAGKLYKGNETAVAGDQGSLLTALKGQAKVEEFFDAATEAEGKKLDAKLGLDTPAAEVKLYVHALEKKTEDKAKKEAGTGKEKAKESPEPTMKKGATPAVTLLFGKTDKDRVYVKRISDKLGVSRVAVPASILEKVAPADGMLAYLDASLPSFALADVVKLELSRPDGKFVVTRSKEKKEAKDKKAKLPAWELVEPKDLPGRSKPNEFQVNDVLGTLAHLKVQKWVRKIDPKDAKGVLTEYGLEPPGLSAIVTFKKDDKTEDFVYKFGKEVTEAKEKAVYALLSQTPIVFLAQPAQVKTVREAEFRDHTIFTFDPVKVKELKMVGWYETAKYLFTLVLERKSGGVWEAPSLKGFDVSSKTVGDFVHALSDLEAKKFVQFKGKAPADYNLGPDDRNLKIEVKMDDGKTTYTLTVGAAAKDKSGYYATASTLPGVVFLLPREPFEAVVGSYSYFSRTKQASAK